MKPFKLLVIILTLTAINCTSNFAYGHESVIYKDINGVSRKLVCVDSLCFVHSSGEFVSSKESLYQSKEKCNSNVFPVYLNDKGKLCSVLNKIILKLKSDRSIKNEILKLGIQDVIIEPSLPNMYIVSFDNNVDVFTISSKLSALDDVEFCVPDFVNKIENNSASTGNYQYSPLQWGIKNNTNNIDANVLNAWGITRGDSTIKIAVMDMGVYLNHPNLYGNLVPGYDATLSNDGALNGDCVYDSSHGTFCAGIIAAHPISGNLMSGVAPNCKIMPIRLFLNGAIYVPDDAICRAFNYAYNNNADIISCSWDTDSEILESIINYISQSGRNGKGTVVVAASGNANSSITHTLASSQNVISVGAIDSEGTRWTTTGFIIEGSNYGSSLDLVAPGDNIYSCYYGRDESAEGKPTIFYNTGSGTSFAAPFVAGAAALLLSVNRDLTLAQIKEALLSTCRKLNGSGYSYNLSSLYGRRDTNEETGYGLLDCYSAIQHIMPEIVGPDAVAGNSETFYINNLPPDATVDWWESSGGFYLSNQTTPDISLPNAGLLEYNSFPGVLHASVRLANGYVINITKEVFYIYSGIQASNNLLQGYFSPFEGECYLDPEPYGAYDYFWEIDNGWEVYSFNNHATFTNRIAIPYSGNVTVTVTYRDYTRNESQISKQFYIGGDEFSCFSVFPNPSSSLINITSKIDEINTKTISNVNPIVAWRLYSEQGTLVIQNQGEIEQVQASIDISSLREGRYILLVSNGEKWFEHKIIKTN